MMSLVACLVLLCFGLRNSEEATSKSLTEGAREI